MCETRQRSAKPNMQPYWVRLQWIPLQIHVFKTGCFNAYHVQARSQESVGSNKGPLIDGWLYTSVQRSYVGPEKVRYLRKTTPVISGQSQRAKFGWRRDRVRGVGWGHGWECNLACFFIYFFSFLRASPEYPIQRGFTLNALKTCFGGKYHLLILFCSNRIRLFQNW